jgi:hypothetical protein
MIPVPGLENVVYSWATIKSEGQFVLHGFFLYAVSDHNIPEYVSSEGMLDLDAWSTDDCGIFVVHSPSSQWIDYAQKSSHTWWRNSFTSNSPLSDMFAEIAHIPLVEIDGTQKSLSEFLMPTTHNLLLREEITNILKKFSLIETQHPCLILFKDLNDKSFWYIDFESLVGLPIQDLRKEFKEWFGTGEFRRILAEAKN